MPTVQETFENIAAAVSQFSPFTLGANVAGALAPNAGSAQQDVDREISVQPTPGPKQVDVQLPTGRRGAMESRRIQLDGFVTTQEFAQYREANTRALRSLAARSDANTNGLGVMTQGLRRLPEADEFKALRGGGGSAGWFGGGMSGGMGAMRDGMTSWLGRWSDELDLLGAAAVAYVRDVNRSDRIWRPGAYTVGSFASVVANASTFKAVKGLARIVEGVSMALAYTPTDATSSDSFTTRDGTNEEGAPADQGDGFTPSGNGSVGLGSLS